MVPAGARPAVLEAAGADHEDRHGEDRDGRRDGERPTLPAQEPRHDGPDDREEREDPECGDRDDRARHDEDRDRGARRARRAPLPADEQLRPHGDARREEGGERDGDPAEARAHLKLTATGETGQATRLAARHDTAPRDVQRAPCGGGSLVELVDQQRHELLAVPLAPRPRVPGGEPTGPSLGIAPGAAHDGDHPASRRRSPSTATWRCSRRWVAAPRHRPRSAGTGGAGRRSRAPR